MEYAGLQKREERGFGYHFKMVAVVHVALVVMLLFVAGVKGCFRGKTEVVIPMEFMVEAPYSPDLMPDPVIPDPVPLKIPEKKPEKIPEKIPEKKPPRKRPEIKVNDQRVVRNPNNKPPRKQLSPEEIQKRLKMGAKIGNRTDPIPDEDSRCDILVQRALYKAWMPPDVSEVGNVQAKVRIRLAGNGVVTGRELVKSSGNDSMDASVMQAARAVKRIDGLTPGFLKRNEYVTILFVPR